MSKLTHKKKVKLARKLLNGKLSRKVSFVVHDGKEAKTESQSFRTPIFNNAAWNTRRDGIARRVKKQQQRAHERALARIA